MRTLYVTDLDGTLLNSKSAINSYTIETINQLVEKGMLFTYATARSLVSASVVTKGLSTKIPVIAYNGTFIFQADTGAIIAEEKFESSDIAYIISMLNTYNISPLVYSFIEETKGKSVQRVSWVTTKETKEMQPYLNSRKGDKRMRPLKTEERLYDGKIFYFTCIGKKEDLQPLYNVLSMDERFACTLQPEPHHPEEYWCEIMPKKATKANAILKLKEIWNCDKIISFGDAMNDIPMFEISDECYAVENAMKELKRIATGVIGKNDEDAVAKWLEKNVEV